MQRNHRLFFLLGLLLLFSVFLAYLFYIVKYKPFPPKPPVAAYRIPASDSISYANAFLYDFENFKQTDLLSTTKAFSGKYALRIKGKKEFSLLIQKPLTELPQQLLSEANISAWMLTDTGNTLNGKLMFQIVDKTNSLKYSYAVNLDDVAPTGNQWFYISGKAVISNYRQEPTDIVKVYYWNNGKGEVFIDDVLIVIGNQQLKGVKPVLDQTPDNYTFTAKPNQPPYPTIYAQKTLVVNLKNTLVISTDGKTSLEFNDNDDFLTRHFIPGINKTEQLLLIRHHLPYAFLWFVPEKNEFSFITIDQKIFPVDLTNIRLYAADINGDGTEEVIYISGNPQDFKVYSINVLTKKLQLYSAQKSQIHNRIMQVQKLRIKTSPNESLFVTDITGATFLLSFEKDKWNTRSLGTINEASQMNYDSQIISGRFTKADGNDNILLLYREKKSGKCFYKLFEINPLELKNTCLQQGNFDNKCDTLYPENIYFAADVDENGVQELISFSNKWRFDMKLLSFTEKDYRIMGNIDFNGYEADHNPKYYENLMISTGHFTDSKSFSFFTVCRNNESIPDLPETVGIYSLPFTHPIVAK